MTRARVATKKAKYVEVAHAGASLVLVTQESISREVARLLGPDVVLQTMGGCPPADDHRWLVEAGVNLERSDEVRAWQLGPGDRSIVAVSTDENYLRVSASSEPVLVLNTVRQVRHILRFSLSQRVQLSLHAGLVSLGRTGIAIVGDKMSGKTSTILALMLRPESAYVANDDVSVDMSGPRPTGLGWARSIRVRGDTVDALELRSRFSRSIRLEHPENTLQVFPPRKALDRDDIVYLFPEELSRFFDRPIVRRCEINAIVFPTFTDTRGPKLSVIEPGEALAALSKNAPGFDGELPGAQHAPHLDGRFQRPCPDETRRLLERLAADVPAYALRQSFADLHESAGLLIELAASLGARDVGQERRCDASAKADT